ncbi:Matrix metalloproteinase-16 [Araneus ventricosus]|uniref:Matrix metalloproteinase-16 n=1 Tax=Araneus ventricosus TaxID=182803 RepID=A0A4Y2IJU0_ARAVE|nr:Matrix metalloproteinase-16 [Araneus ventricosus]
MRNCVPLAAFIGCCIVIAALALPINNEEEAALYLQKFGYLEDSGYRVGALVAPDTINSAIKDFQRFAGLNQTGVLDNDTIDMMNTPRCGVKDKIGHASFARRKRYALQGSKWKKTDLTYRISKYPERLKDRTKVDKEIARAFKALPTASGYDDWFHTLVICKRTPVPVFLALQCITALKKQNTVCSFINSFHCTSATKFPSRIPEKQAHRAVGQNHRGPG